MSKLILLDLDGVLVDNFNKNGGMGLLFKQPWNDGIDRNQIIELIKNHQDFASYRIIN
jgi:hypothetical protein